MYCQLFFESFFKYNRSSIKGDENPYGDFTRVIFEYKYNRSSIKGDENFSRIASISSVI